MKHHPIFEAFERIKVEGNGKCVFDFLGVATDCSFKNAWQKYALKDQASLIPAYPVVNEHYFDWIALLKCIQSAAGTFRMAELGAGWAPWLVRSVYAAKQKSNIQHIELLGIEAEPKHFEWMLEHFRQNHLDPDNYFLLHGAVSKREGILKFPKVENPGENYGASLLDLSSNQYLEVTAYQLDQLLAKFSGPLDFLHIDIQGEEYSVLPDAFEHLKEKVKAIMVGTHISQEKHEELAGLFKRHGWIEDMLYPKSKEVETEYGLVRFDDGFQFWKNPVFFPELCIGTTKPKIDNNNQTVEHNKELMSRVMSFEGMTTEHGVALMDIFIKQALKFRDEGYFFEFGAFKGRSAAIFALNQNDKIWLHAVDEGNRLELDRLLKISSNITWHKTKSERFCAESLPKLAKTGTIIVSHHDASHFFDNVVTELESVRDYMNTAGIIILDDFNDPFSQVRAAYYYLRFCHKFPFEILLIGFNKCILVHETFFDTYENFILTDLIGSLIRFGYDCRLFRTDVHPLARGFHVNLKTKPDDDTLYGRNYLGDRFYQPSKLILPKTSQNQIKTQTNEFKDWKDALRKLYPWPDLQGVEFFYFSLDGGGRDLLTDLIKERKISLMLEIGCFLCGSTLQWLQASEELTVVGVDPWQSDFSVFLEKYDSNPRMNACFSQISDRKKFIDSVRQYGSYISALANVQAYRDRFYPVKNKSPQVLSQLHQIGLKPDLIYFDNTKVLDDLYASHELFPEAILCGDDWTWGAEEGFPVQKAVNAFCQEKGFTVHSKRMTWILEPLNQN